jgi:hypothetical protein
VVVQLNETFYHDISALDFIQAQAYEAQRVPAQYDWHQFRIDVLTALQAHYGAASVDPRNKCITVLAGGARLTADLVVAAEFRQYSRFASPADEAHTTGMTFWTIREGRQIVNWPKQHYDNGVAKNHRRRTNGHFKPAVRMIKNARSTAVDRRLLLEADAPSFLVECLIYNVPDEQFVSSRQQTFYNVLSWLESRDMSEFVCGNTW